MGFFDAIGKVFNPKNILTAGGFLVGGPPGAAVGRGIGGGVFGDNWDPTDDGSLGERLGGGAQGAIEGAAMGMGGQALGLPGSSKGFADIPGIGGLAGGGGGGAVGAMPSFSMIPDSAYAVAPPSLAGAGATGGASGMLGGAAGQAAQAAGAGVEGGQGGFLGSIKNMWGDLNSYEKLMMGAQGVGALGSLYGSIEQGRLRDEQEDRRGAFSEALMPYFQSALTGLDDPSYYERPTRTGRRSYGRRR